MTSTTVTLTTLMRRKTSKLVRWLMASVGGGMVGCGVGDAVLEIADVVQRGRVAAEGAGGEECVAGGKDEIAAGCLDLDKVRGGGCEVLVVTGEQLQARERVAGNESLDLVENGHGIEGAEARLKVVRGEPDGMAVGLAGLRAAGLAHISAKAGAEGNERADIRADFVGEADDHLEVGAHAGAVGG